MLPDATEPLWGLYRFSILSDKISYITIIQLRYMKFKVTNFGPIKKADFELAPLTVIIGKNNIGKSFLAQLIYVLITTFCGNRRLSLKRRNFVSAFGYISFSVAVPKEMIDESRKYFKNDSLSNLDILKNIVPKLAALEYPRKARAIKELLEQTYGMNVKDLVNLHSRKSQMELEINNFSITRIIITKKGDVSVVNKFSQKQYRQLESSLRTRIDFTRTRKRLTKDTIRVTLQIILRTIYETDSIEPIYIPAGRAGLMESYDTVVSALISVSPVAPLRGITVPPLPGIAAQFYMIIRSLSLREGPLSEISDDFQTIFNGDILMRRSSNIPSEYKLVYKFRSGEKESTTDLIHAGSMVKELAPIYLIIKKISDKDTFLIIEEPESHLHPGAQIKLINTFCKVINSGLNMLVTTHSDLIIRRISHLIGLGELNKSNNGSYFKNDQVKIYFLKEGNKGSIIELISIPPEGSLDNIPTFDEVIKQLYEDESKIQQMHQNEG